MTASNRPTFCVVPARTAAFVPFRSAMAGAMLRAQGEGAVRAYAFVPTGSMHHGEGAAVSAPVGACCGASSPVPSIVEDPDYPMADVLRLLGHKLVRRALDMDRKLAVEYVRAARDRWDGIDQDACAALIVSLREAP